MTTVSLNLKYQHEVTATCTHCRHARELDLKALQDACYGDVELTHLPLRCTECGEKRHRITTPGARPAGW